MKFSKLDQLVLTCFGSMGYEFLPSIKVINALLEILMLGMALL